MKTYENSSKFPPKRMKTNENSSKFPQNKWKFILPMKIAQIGDFGTKMTKIGKFWDKNGLQMD